MADLLYGRAWVLLQEGFRAQDKSGRAIGALKSVVIHESLLNRMELAWIGQSLDRYDLFFFGQARQKNARAYRFAVDQYRARAAHADAATLARAKQFVLAAQYLEQRLMGVHRMLIFNAVDFEFDDLFHEASSMRVLTAGSTIVQREQNLFSGEREIAKTHAGGVVQCDANGRHNRRQQGLADAVEVCRSRVFQRARIDLPR